jgi:hypothetical protein
MNTITLEDIKERHAEISAMIAQFEEDAKKPSFFEYQGERINLKQGEIYVGTITTPGEYGCYHLILLPGDIETKNWKAAMEWADEQGGELPNRVEGALMFATLKSEFSESYYWTRETHKENSAYAWCQNFYYGNQNSDLKDASGCRARAVRRLIIE